MKSQSVRKMTAAALLVAVGIVIPLFSPIKVVLEPASFTLASHVAVFLAMFISPPVAVAVAAGTTLGFFLGPFPLVVTLRAASHLVFALVGSLLLQKRPQILSSPLRAQPFSLVIALLHAACEVLVVSAFYFGGAMGTAYYARGYWFAVMLLVGVGSVVHSMVDFGIALLLYNVLRRQRGLQSMFIQPPAPRQNMAQ